MHILELTGSARQVANFRVERLDDLSTECDGIAFLVFVRGVFDLPVATAGAARRKSASASLSCRRRGA